MHTYQNENRFRPWRRLTTSYATKRGLDVCLLLLTSPFWLPALAVVFTVCWFTLGWPVFFTQMRPGRYHKPFRIIKFRTMRNILDGQGQLLPEEQRLSPFGQFLRSTSLDELPELWNVLRGELSLVGPRPLLMQYLPLYSPEQDRRHEVPPGITGWAQIHGRNSLSWDEKFALDVWYVNNRSLLLDVQILLKTVLRVVQRDGINHQGSVTMPAFDGSSKSQSNCQ
jgi:sugar transferase EpsL